MRQLIYFTLFTTVLFFSCNNSEDLKKEDSNDSISINDHIILEEIDTTHLIIEGNSIWVRSEPFTGEVVMKLNSGDNCKILDKTDVVQVRNMKDRWYKIEYNDTIGWVFGSQTNLKTGETINIMGFSTYMTKFIRAFNDKDDDLKSFEHNKIGSYFLFNPGVYCSGGPHSGIERSLPNPIPVKNSFNEIPKGDFCEGYPNVIDGFYYQSVKANELPTYVSGWDDAGDVLTEKVTVPKEYQNNEIKKVTVVIEEYHFAYLYFLNIETTWYLICFDYCDCSA